MLARHQSVHVFKRARVAAQQAMTVNGHAMILLHAELAGDG